jgi:AcrR family transcriptional regulator
MDGLTTDGDTTVTQPQELGTGGRRQRRARGSLSADEILRGAFVFVQNESVDALSMPRLGQHLGVGVTSIYWYYKSKEELLDAMTMAAMNRFYELLPEFPGLPWDEHLKQFFGHVRLIFQTNHVLCDLVIMRSGNFTSETVRSTWDRLEGLLAVLTEAGFGTDDAAQAYFSLSVYTRGCLMIERMTELAPRRHDLASMGGTLQKDLANQQRFPILLEQSRRTTFSMVDDVDFEFGLENAVAGLRERLAATTNRSDPDGPSD